MALKPINDSKLEEVLAHTRNKASTKNIIDTSDRSYVTWFKLRHKFIQEIPGLPDFSLAKCGNPNCPQGERTKGAIAVVNNLEMCRECFMAGYGRLNNISPDPQLTLPS